MDFLAALYNIFFVGSVCGLEDGKQAGSMFSSGPGGAQDLREEIEPKCHFDLACRQHHHAPLCHLSSVLMRLTIKSEVSEMQHIQFWVRAQVVTSDRGMNSLNKQ